MASAEQIKALLKSHIEGDDERFLSVAMQVAAHEAKLGHGKLAVELRALETMPRTGTTHGRSTRDRQTRCREYAEPHQAFWKLRTRKPGSVK